MRALVFVAAVAAGCGSSHSAAVDGGGGGGGGGDGNAGDGGASLVAARPYMSHVPTGYNAATAAPLVILLHGYSASGELQEEYFELTATSDANGFLYAYPDGLVDQTGNRFWNADDACCDFYNVAVDDVAYVNAIIDDMSSKYNVDPKRVYVIGHSNGGFMSHRVACDLTSRVAAIVSLAGEVWNDPTKCVPSETISVLDVHGDADTTIDYNGGSVASGVPPYPSEMQTMNTWATKNGCTGALAANGVTLDLDSSLAGNETAEATFGGCPTGIDVELWTIHGGSHIPDLTHPTWGDSIWAFLAAHPKS